MSARSRRILSTVLLALTAVLLPVGLLAGWAGATVYDSNTFSERAVDLLRSPAVRRELADRLTEQLARDGNPQAVNFRPAFQLAIEAAVDTDTFRSIFRTAVRRTHAAVLDGEGQAGLDLSDSVTIIATTLQLPENAQPGQESEDSLGSSFADITERFAGSWIWSADEVVSAVAVGALLGALVSGAAAIAVDADRRRATRRLGAVVIGAGLFLVVMVQVAGVAVGRLGSEPSLGEALEGGFARLTADLVSLGLWAAGYGVVLAAAASAIGHEASRITIGSSRRRIEAWVRARRSTTGGTIWLGVLAVVAGLAVVASPDFWARAALVLLGLWLVYFGITEVLGLVRTRVDQADAVSPSARRRRRVFAAAVIIVAVVAVFTGGLVFTTTRAARTAAASGQLECNGEASLCDQPLNAVIFPGSHNSMSSSLYPGWLFAEQISTVKGQLDYGVRALLIDTHYGIPSSSRLPGSETPIILTDRSAELVQPVGEEIDPAVEARANQLASRAPRAANASRSIYLCHNFCELGAVPFSTVLADIKTFLDTHPDDVVTTIIQDATQPDETAAAIEAAGLGERVWTLTPDEPIPTMRDLIESGRTLLVFAEKSGSGAPDWYHPAYEWFQETTFTFLDIDSLSCEPNRGPPDAPFFLVNHWVAASPPSPALAGEVNARDVLERRIERCFRERGQIPNVVAVDFAERGDLRATTDDLNLRLLRQLGDVRAQLAGTAPAEPETPTSAGAGGTTTTVAGLPAIDSGVVLTTLTGGDPSAFCATVDDAVEVLSAWALATFVVTPTTRGQPDLAFGPLAVRRLDASSASAPVEVQRQLGPLRARAAAAVDRLRALGLSDDDISAAADLTAELLAASANPDPVLVEQQVITSLATKVSTTLLGSTAIEFAAANPESPGLFDLGRIDPAAATAAGYGCLAEK